nr:M20/M25/M40 family metallo-hydrolase [Candidatus Freyarchaeota archaeon]
MVSFSNAAVEIKEFIKYFCEEVGPRPPCSEQEAKAAKLLKKKFDEYCDKTSIENFTCRPGAYRAAFRGPIILYILSTISYIVAVYFGLRASTLFGGYSVFASIWDANLLFFFLLLLLVAISISLFSVVVVIVGSLMYTKETIDIFFREKSSTNVIGKMKPKGNAKKLVLISGHHDANWEFPMIRKFGSKFTSLQAVSVISNYMILAILIIRLILYLLRIPLGFLIEIILLLVLVAPIPILVYVYPNLISDTPVMGANDNLTGMAVCYEVARYISTKELRPKETEVWVVSFGCEEIGDRGSKRFVKKYYDELKDAYNVNLDIVGEKESSLYIVEKEVRSLIKLSPEVIDILKSIAGKLRIKVNSGCVDAYTDAMSFAQKGIKSASIIAVGSSKFPKYYHTTDDVPDNLDYKLVADALRICLEFIKQIDQSL